VAGYDIHKLLLGSLGTLGILTRANFRTFPLPRAQRAFVAGFRDTGGALQFCRALAQSPLKPAVVEVLDAGAGRVVATDKLPGGSWCVVAAAIGHEAVVERHARDLAQLAEQAGAASFAALEEPDKQALLGNVREFLRLTLEQHPGAAILRMGVLPAAMPMACQRLREAAASKGMVCALVIRAGSLLYLAFWPGAEPRGRLAEGVRAITEAASVIGPAFIEFCPAELKKEIHVWGPAGDDFELMQRVKRVFDPQGVLSPGRFIGGL
jgi:glycolate oxidase FAD binding subunit